MELDFTEMTVPEAVSVLVKSGLDETEAQERAKYLTGNFGDDFMTTDSQESFLTLKHPGHADQSVHGTRNSDHVDDALVKKHGMRAIAAEAARRAGQGHLTKPSDFDPPIASKKPIKPGIVKRITDKWKSIPPEAKMSALKKVAGVGAAVGLAALGAAAHSGYNSSAGKSARYAHGLSSGHRKWGGGKRGSMSDFLRTEDGKSFAQNLATNIYKGGNANRYGHKEQSMDIVTEIVAALKEIAVATFKHPGHPDQSVHGKGATRTIVGGALRKLASGHRKVFGDRPSNLEARGLDAIGKRLQKSGANARKTAIDYDKKHGASNKRSWDNLKKGVKKRVSSLWRDTDSDLEALSNSRKEATQFFTEKETGRPRWLSVSSGGYPDKDGQWVTSKALEDWAERFMANQKETSHGLLPLRDNDQPVVYRYWHLGEPNVATKEAGPGIDLGYADFAAFQDGHLILSGLFYDDEVGKAFMATQKEWGNSIGFFHAPTEPDANNEFHRIDVFENSALPMGKASYPFTHTVVVKE